MSVKTKACLLSLTAFSGLIYAQEGRAKPTDPAKAALIEEMMRLTQPDKVFAQLIQLNKAAFSKGFEESFRNRLSKCNQEATNYEPELHRFEDEMFDLIADRMSWEKLKPKFAAIYDETFSKQELSDIVAFYKTPSGQSLLQKMPRLIARGSQLGQAQISGANAELERLTIDFIQRFSKAHSASMNCSEKH